MKVAGGLQQVKMGDDIDIDLLMNCTMLAVNRFALESIVNSTDLTSLNRTELVNFLTEIISSQDYEGTINTIR